MVAVALIIAAVVGVKLYLGFAHFDDSMCGVTVVRRTPSPNGRLEAVLFERNCGATTDFGTNLSVLKRGSQIPNDPGNLLVADSDHGRAPLEPGHVIRLSVDWLGSDSLIVRFDRRARVFRQDNHAHGVSVRYAVIDEPGA
jgi:hypothetical protein